MATFFRFCDTTFLHFLPRSVTTFATFTFGFFLKNKTTYSRLVFLPPFTFFWSVCPCVFCLPSFNYCLLYCVFCFVVLISFTRHRRIFLFLILFISNFQKYQCVFSGLVWSFVCVVHLCVCRVLLFFFLFGFIMIITMISSVQIVSVFRPRQQDFRRRHST